MEAGSRRMVVIMLLEREFVAAARRSITDGLPRFSFSDVGPNTHVAKGVKGDVIESRCASDIGNSKGEVMEHGTNFFYNGGMQGETGMACFTNRVVPGLGPRTIVSRWDRSGLCIRLSVTSPGLGSPVAMPEP